MKNMIMILCCFLAFSTYAQKKVLVETQEEVEALAIKDLERAMTGPEGELFLFGKENTIEGEYTFKLSLGDKGKVTSIFVIERVGGDIPMQNKVKDAAKEFRFSFKLPKGKYFKIQYTFKF